VWQPTEFIVSFDVTFLSHAQPRDCGDYRHRTLWPAQALGALTPTVAVQTIHPEVFTAVVQARVLVVGMVVDADVQVLVEYRKKMGLPTVYEISDDFKAFPDNTELAPFYARPEVQSHIEHMAQICDAVQFSSPFLAEKYGYLNAKQVVFMNQAWEVPALSNRPENTRPRIGWTASGGHLDDARALAQLLAQAKSANPGLFDRFVLCLMTTPKNASAFEDAGLQFELTPTGNFEQYMDFVGSLDAGLAHLGSDDFAQGRSDGKYIEYASRGVPALCHNSGTFQHTVRHMANGMLYANASEFAQSLSQLVQDPKLRQHLRSQAHRNLKGDRNHELAAQDRFDFYQDLVFQSADSERADHGSPFAQSGFISMEDPIESPLRKVMQIHNQGPKPETLQEYFQLSQQAPGSWMLWERFGALYQSLGLEEHLAAIQSRAVESKSAALDRAFKLAA
jgi:glycosyltransferase involved in cell wall biosynthesis